MMNIHVTNHSRGTKMENIQSIGTTSNVNPICAMRKQVCGGICEKCYADALCKFRHSLNAHLQENYNQLTSRLMTEDEAKAVNINRKGRIIRIESFGDVGNVTQARNYLRIIKARPRQRFGIWSKNWGIWLAAFKKEGKPANCTFVLSSMDVNKPTDVHPKMAEFVDHVFTVWDKKTYPSVIEKNPKTECAALHCDSCRKCYRKNTSFYINERLR